ncbi:MAG: hypothetical protein CM15mV96_080 [uncultured marine virus]|nr:MAG: hypothetical protein CM15mV96_080 [uncultured marine virus]
MMNNFWARDKKIIFEIKIELFDAEDSFSG